jgi:hypothetical protein
MDPDDKTYRGTDILDPTMGLTFRIAAALLASQWEGWHHLEEVTQGALQLAGALALREIIDYDHDGPPDSVHPINNMAGWFDTWAKLHENSMMWADHPMRVRVRMTRAARMVWDALTPWTGRAEMWQPLIRRAEGLLQEPVDTIDVDALDVDDLEGLSIIWTDDEAEA